MSKKFPLASGVRLNQALDRMRSHIADLDRQIAKEQLEPSFGEDSGYREGLIQIRNQAQQQMEGIKQELLNMKAQNKADYDAWKRSQVKPLKRKRFNDL